MMAPKKRMLYSLDQLNKALDRVRNGGSIRGSSRLYGIPESTIHDKLNQRYSKPPGAPPVIRLENEERMVKWLIDMAKAGLPLNTKRLRMFVAKYVKLAKIKNPFKNGILGPRWVAGFLKRHPNISRRVASSLSKCRASVTPAQIKRWFEEITAYIEEKHLESIMEKPTQIFNMDETAVRTTPTRDVLLAESNKNQVHSRVGNLEKESYTALFAGNAAGMLAPTMVLFPYKQRMPGEIFQRLPKGWAAGRTDSGWMTRDTFAAYLKDVFYPWLLREKIPFPVIIFVDGHSSHVSAESIAFCKAKNLTLICLPPNTTQITQPLDVSFFRPFKEYWNQLLVDWRIDHADLPRSEIAPLLHKAVKQMWNLESTLINGFRRCGLHPWNAEAVDYSSLLQPPKHGETSQECRENVHAPENPQTVASPGNLLIDIQNYMTQQQVDVFNRSISSGKWLGTTEEIALFEVWQKIKYGQNNSVLTPTVDCPVQARMRSSLDAEPPFEGWIEGPSSPIQEMPLDLSFRSIELSVERQVDVLGEIFCIPNIEQRVSQRPRKKPQPPSVATSEAYDKYLENIENIKTAALKEKEMKKTQRQAKRKLQTDKKGP
ncbi:tigger transposable element-derived protein 1-like isoform X2 [Aedes albopictus]